MASSFYAEGTHQIEKLVSNVLTALGENPEREGLRDTPKRVQGTFEFLTSGYKEDLSQGWDGAILATPENSSELVQTRNIEFYSLCEHHLLPFYGKCHIAYLPKVKQIEVSELPRLVEMFSHRLQIQERLTVQIGWALEKLLEPEGVAVITEAYHLCMMMRGPKKQTSLTVASCRLGALRYFDWRGR
jgi:GTP cyclohydrolase I